MAGDGSPGLLAAATIVFSRSLIHNCSSRGATNTVSPGAKTNIAASASSNAISGLRRTASISAASASTAPAPAAASTGQPAPAPK